MKKFIVLLFVAASVVACAQTAPNVISTSEVARIESFLASDQMRGRRAGTPDIDKAADFIAGEFKKAGLQPLSGNSFLQEFSMLRPRMTSLKFEVNGKDAETKNVIVVTSQPDLKVNGQSGYAIEKIATGENLFRKAQQIVGSNKNTVVFVDSSFTQTFSRLMSFKRQMFKTNSSVVFILADQEPSEFTVKAEHSFDETKYANVVGILPGKSRSNEYIIFSGHYDHLGVARQPQNGDSIYNGANDDAAGTTAVIMLANYFKQQNNNERTLVFAAFTAEEVGGFGSRYFSQQFDPQKVVAMFNIEMIGTESKWGKNSAYITGYDKTDMGEILQKNLKGTGFHFYPDPYPTENLFYRSDNATLARLGVPAHTISTSKMDSEPNYHQLSDEVSTLDMDNMAQIIRAIALSSKTIISGADTPARVKPESLN